MSLQPSIAEYFISRKRAAVDDLKKESNPAKVLVVDKTIGFNDNELPDINNDALPKKIVYIKKETGVSQTKKKASTTIKAGRSSVIKGCKPGVMQTDIRSLLSTVNKNSERTSVDGSTSIVPMEVSNEQPSTEETTGKSCPLERPQLTFDEKETEPPSVNENDRDLQGGALKTPDRLTSISRQDLNLGRLQNALKSRSSRMVELKAALKRFNEKKAEIENTPTKVAAQPVMGKNKRDQTELQVMPSPIKTPTKIGHLVSPQGKLTPSRLFATPPTPLQPQSPLKSPLKSPAFQRYQALITEDRSTLVLPYKYRTLAELFRSIDQVTSLMVNRKETVTLTKLRPAVQEMSRKNLTEYHLGQIKTVFPKAFEFTVEKYRLGAVEKFELVLNPLLSEENKDGEVMGPSVLLARRRTLFSALLELAKDHHDVFLRTLQPPMNIPKSRITRWHPEFLIDDVPDIVSSALPQPPNVQRAASAKDVLEKARNLFMVNPRMQKALQKVSENCEATLPTLSQPSVAITPPVTTPAIKSALHGVPASILERVRAKQAARALEAMTRTPAQAKEAVRITRLPELARILRNLFVTEKRGVLTREMVLEKLADSYRESLSTGELDDHLKLLAEKTPGWVTFCNLRKTDYVKLSRNADMNRIMTRLEELAAEKCI